MQKITTIEELHEALESIEQLPDDSRITRLYILADIKNLIDDNEELQAEFTKIVDQRGTQRTNDCISFLRITMMDKMPFYGYLIYMIKAKSNTSVKTACTNGKDILFNPRFMYALSDGEIYFVMLHELYHIIYLHTYRTSGASQHKKWNRAEDYKINQDLMDLIPQFQAFKVAIKMPAGCLFNPDYKEMTSEQIFAILPDQQEDDDDDDPLAGDLREVGGNSDESAAGEDIVDQADAESFIKNAIKQAETYARERGMNTDGIREQFDFAFRRGVVNWKTLLKRMLSTCISDEVSYATPERKYLNRGLILPGKCESENINDIWFCIDTSGSISTGELQQFLNEAYSIVSSFGEHFSMNIIYWHTSVAEVYRDVSSVHDLKKAVTTSSGGTDINCVFEWLEGNIRPRNVRGVVVATDGYFGEPSSHFVRQYKGKVIYALSDVTMADSIRQYGKVASLTQE